MNYHTSIVKIGVKIFKTSTVPVYFSRGRNLNETSELSFPARLSLLKRDYNRSLRSQTKMSKKQIPFNILREFWGKIYIPHIILRLKHMTDLFFHVFLWSGLDLNWTFWIIWLLRNRSRENNSVERTFNFLSCKST